MEKFLLPGPKILYSKSLHLLDKNLLPLTPPQKIGKYIYLWILRTFSVNKLDTHRVWLYQYNPVSKEKALWDKCCISHVMWVWVTIRIIDLLHLVTTHSVQYNTHCLPMWTHLLSSAHTRNKLLDLCVYVLFITVKSLTGSWSTLILCSCPGTSA